MFKVVATDMWLGLFHKVLRDSKLRWWLADAQTSLITLIVLPQRSKLTVMRDLNHSKLTLCRLQAVATACSKVYQVNTVEPLLKDTLEMRTPP